LELTSQAALPKAPDHRWRGRTYLLLIGALTELPMDKIIIERRPSKIGKDGRRHYLIRTTRTQIPRWRRRPPPAMIDNYLDQ
jgi:hypothetical protein